MLSSRVVIIAVTGRSGSGKTTVADNIVKHFGEENAVKLPTDRYYFGRPENQTREEFNANTDFDHPNSLNWKQLVDDLEQLAAGNDVHVPSYSFKTSESKPNADLVRARSIIVVEGIFALHDPDVRKRIGITVFVHAPGDVALARRAIRDKKERDYSTEHTINLVTAVLRPSYVKFIKPWKHKTHIFLDNSPDVVDTACVSIAPIIELAEEKLKAGTLIMLMGSSGVGKSTIIAAPAEIATRMNLAPAEIEACKDADVSLVNDDLDKTVAAVNAHIPRMHTTFLAHNGHATTAEHQLAARLPAEQVAMGHH